MTLQAWAFTSQDLSVSGTVNGWDGKSSFIVDGYYETLLPALEQISRWAAEHLPSSDRGM